MTHEYTSGLGDYTVTVTADAPADVNGAYGEVTLAAEYKEVKVVPAAPSGFSATAGEVAGTVHLEWDASGSAIATGYRVLLDDGSAAGPQVVADGIAPDVTSFDMSMLAEGTYTVALEAASEAGASAAATVANVTVAPYVPWPGGGPGGTAVHPASSGALLTDTPHSGAEVNLGFAINFYGIHTDSIYVAESGIVVVPMYTGASPLWAPWFSMAEATFSVIAPYWSQTNLEGTGVGDGGSVTYGAATCHDDATGKDFGAFHVTWADMWNSAAVGHESLYNTFELYLVNRADTGAGNFDIVFKYDDIEWSVRDGGTDAAETGYSRGLPSVSGSYKESGGPIRNPQYTLTVTDTVSGAKLEDTDNDPARPGGILGAVTSQDDGLGHLNIKVDQTGGDNLQGPSWRLDWTAVDASPTPGSGDFAPTGDVDVTVGPSANPWTVKVTNLHDPAFERDIKVFVATVAITWSGTGDLIDVGTLGDLYNDPHLSTHYPHGADLSRKGPINIFAGQKIALKASVSLPAGATWTGNWDLGGSFGKNGSDYVKGFDPSKRRQQLTPLTGADLLGDTVDFYDVADGVRVFKVTGYAWISGQPVRLTNKVTFNVHKPGQSIWNGAGPWPGAPRQFQVKGTEGPVKVEFDPTDRHVWLRVETTWQTSIPPVADGYAGTVKFAQLWKGFQATNGRFGMWWRSTGSDWALDDAYPYDNHSGGPQDPQTPNESDMPGVVALAFHTWLCISMEFHDWVMWAPPGDGIDVPIQDWTWKVSGRASWNATTKVWHLDGSLYPEESIDFVGHDTNVFPEWTQVVATKG